MVGRGWIGWAVRLAYGVGIFVVATVVLALLFRLLLALGAGKVLAAIEQQAATALDNLTPMSVSDRFSELSRPDCSGAGTITDIARCNDIWGMLLLRAPVGLARLLGEMLASPVVVRIVNLMTLLAGFAASAALALGVRPRPNLLVGTVVTIGLGIFFASLLSYVFLLALEFGARISGDVLHSGVGLPFFGGTWAGFVCGCSGKWIDGVLHHRVSRLIERLLPQHR